MENDKIRRNPKLQNGDNLKLFGKKVSENFAQSPTCDHIDVK